MQIKVSIRMPQFAEAVKSQIDAVVPQALTALATFARDRITTAAQKKLRGSQLTEYIRGLNAPDSLEIKESSAVIRLVGDFPTALEKGSPSFSIKDAMLAKATKKDKDGKPYVDVPFRHGAEDSTTLQAMPSGVAATMKQAVHQAQQELKSGGASDHTARMARVRAKTDSPPKTITKTLYPSGEKAVVQHKVGIHADMLRVPKMYAKAIQATYMTIRRISVNSAPSSWIHPGFQPANIFDEVLEEVQALAPKIFSDVLAKAGFG